MSNQFTGVTNYVPLVQGTAPAPLVEQPRVEFASAQAQDGTARNGQTAVTQDAYAVSGYDTANTMQNGPAWNHAAISVGGSDNDTSGSSSSWLVHGNGELAHSQLLPEGSGAKSAEYADGQGAECANKQSPEYVAKADGANGEAAERAGIREAAEYVNGQAGEWGIETAKTTADSSMQNVSQPRPVDSLNDLEKRALVSPSRMSCLTSTR